MASIQCNPEVDFCGTPDAVEGNYFQRMHPETAQAWYGMLAYFSLCMTDWIAYETRNSQGLWNSKSRRRSRNQNSAIWAWNIMFFWHNFVFFGVFNFWAIGKIHDRNKTVDWLFYKFVGLSMAGPYGVYEIIITLLIAAVTSNEADNYTEKNSTLLFWYSLSAVITGIFQFLLHKGVTEWYYLEYTGEWGVSQEDIPANPEENATDNEIVGFDDQKSDSKNADAGKLFRDTTVF